MIEEIVIDTNVFIVTLIEEYFKTVSLRAVIPV